MDLDRFKHLKNDAEKTQSEADRAQGNVDALMQRLQEEYGCTSIKTAKAMLEEKQAEAADAEEKYDGLLAEFEQELAALPTDAE